MRYIPYQSQICCKVVSLRDYHGHFIRRIKLILRGHVTTGTAVTWQQFVIDGGSSYPWSRLMAGWQVLISMDSRILRRHILSSRAMTLSILIWWGVHGLPQLFVETSVLGGLSSLSPGYGSFTIILLGAFWTLDFIYDTTLFEIRCLFLGVDQDGAQGVERLVASPDSMFCFKFWPVFRMYLWYMVGPRWCGPGLLWSYERCRAWFWLGGSWRPTPCSHWPWVRTWHSSAKPMGVRGCANGLGFKLLHVQVGYDRGHWRTHGRSMFLFIDVPLYEKYVAFRQKDCSSMMRLRERACVRVIKDRCSICVQWQRWPSGTGLLVKVLRNILIRRMKWQWWSRKLATLQHSWLW